MYQLTIKQAIIGSSRSTVEPLTRRIRSASIAAGGTILSLECLDQLVIANSDEGPFPILLIPSTKNGKLQFWNDLTQQIIEADFSRPNIDDTSGATVMRKGQLIELAEDEPDWDDSDGCPVIKMRPQALNIAKDSDNVENCGLSAIGGGLGLVASSTLNPKGELNAATMNSGIVRSYSSDYSGVVGDTISYVLFVKTADPSNLLLGGWRGGESATFNAAAGTVVANGASANYSKISQPIEGWRKIVVNTTFTNNIGNNLIYPQIQWDGADNALEVFGLAVVNGNNEDYIFTDGATVTRSANTFEFTDLITKGAIAANGDFTLLINPYIYKNVDYNTAVVRFLSGSTQIFNLAMYGDGRLRVLDRINGGWITGTQNFGIGFKPIILAFNGATKILKVYFQGALVGISPNLTLSVDKVEFNAPDDIAYDLHDLDFSPILLNDTEAIAALSQL